MSVLVTGMDIPKNCAECVCSKTRHSSLGDIIDCKRIGTVGSAFKDPYNILNNRHPDCPLFEVTAHGRLIDADAFDERVRVAGGMSEEELTEDFKDGVQTVLYMMSKQPTIIEAEGSDND